MKKRIILLLLLLFPIQVLAYSDKIIIYPKTIGIEIYSEGIYIIDFYTINNEKTAKNKGFQIGDMIIEVNNQKVSSINDLNKMITNEGTYQIKVKRKGKIVELTLDTVKEDNMIKTGLYVKDQINGIGTLSYIDPETKVFAALGHDILESSTKESFNLKDGFIYQVDIQSINKSTKERIGQLQANFTNQLIGTINNNNTTGIYGLFQNTLPTEKIVEIASKNEIKKGKAYISLLFDNKSQTEYEINIINIDDSNENKNIYFEIKDERLLNKTGGIIQGMSGAPIIQNNKIIGVVNYVVIGTPEKGYGIFIERMLEEGDKLKQ